MNKKDYYDSIFKNLKDKDLNDQIHFLEKEKFKCLDIINEKIVALKDKSEYCWKCDKWYLRKDWDKIFRKAETVVTENGKIISHTKDTYYQLKCPVCGEKTPVYKKEI